MITTHFAGQPGSIAKLSNLCERFGVPLIEDAAHAHGAIASGRKAGTFGSFGCFSLHDTKTLPAGEGGVILTNDPTLAGRVQKLHDLGREAGSQPYEFLALGGNYRMSELVAATASLRLRRLEANAIRRSAGASELRELISNNLPLKPLELEPEVSRHGYHFFPTRYRPEYCHGLSRTRFVLALNAEGIPCNAGWPRPLHALPGVHGTEANTPLTTAAIADSVWIDQRLLLDLEGPRQIVEALLRIQCLADTITRT